MSSLFGGQVSPQTVSPIVGSDTQKNFFTALFGQGLQPNTQDGGMMFKGMTPYTGPTSPDVSQTILPQVYGAYNPTTAGAPLYQNLQQMNQINPGLQQFNNNMLGSIAQQPGAAMAQSIAQTGSPGGFNPLMAFLNARPYSSRGW